MDIFVAFQQMLMLVLVISVGFVLRRQAVLDEVGNVYLTRLLLQVTLPSTAISGIFGSTREMLTGELFFLFAMNILCFAVTIAISLLAPLLLKTERDERGTFAAMALFGNIAFIGIPLVDSLFGYEGVFYVALHIILFNILLFSVGVKLFGGAQAKLSLKFFFSPALVAATSALILFSLNIQLPTVMNSAFRLIGSATPAIALLLLGSILGGMPFREMFRGWRVYVISLVRLVVIPLAVYVAFLPFSLSPLFVKVMLVMAATPMAVSTAALTVQYGTYQELGAKGVFISTLLSVVTMPILLSLLL